MRPIVLAQTGVGSKVSNVNWRQHDFKIGFGCVASGTVTYTIRHTFDNPADFNGEADYIANANWFAHETITGETASADGNYAFPIMAVMLDVTAGTGTVEATFLQA